mgnify:CR=1 FL=1
MLFRSDRMNDVVHIYKKANQRGGKADVIEVPMSDTERVRELIDDDELYEKLLEDKEILEELVAPLDMERVLAAEQTPLFFGE